MGFKFKPPMTDFNPPTKDLEVYTRVHLRGSQDHNPGGIRSKWCWASSNAHFSNVCQKSFPRQIGCPLHHQSDGQCPLEALGSCQCRHEQNHLKPYQEEHPLTGVEMQWVLSHQCKNCEGCIEL
jgi:hypothetical protein